MIQTTRRQWLPGAGTVALLGGGCLVPFRHDANPRRLSNPDMRDVL